MRRISFGLSDLSASYQLGDIELERLRLLLDALEADATAATSVQGRSRALKVHIADSLSGLQVGRLRSARTIVDIGAGAGFPGLPLAICLPQCKVDLLESRAKKLRFAERFGEQVGITNLGFIAERAEEWARADGSAAYEAAVCRALAPLATLIEYAAPLLQTGGLLVAWKGRVDRNEEAAGQRVAELLGGELEQAIAVKPYASSRNHQLYIYKQLNLCPQLVPRRPGLAAKRPLAK